MAEQSNREGWPAERFLGVLLEQEVHERETRRLARARVDGHPLRAKTRGDLRLRDRTGHLQGPRHGACRS